MAEGRQNRTRRRRRGVVLAATVDMSNVFYDGIVQSLAARVPSVHVVSAPGPVALRLFGNVAQVHTLSMERRLSPIRDLGSLIGWMSFLMRVRPRQLVVGTPKASLLAGIAGRATGVPEVVYIVHGLRSEQSVGAMEKVLRSVERLTLKNAHRIVAVSPSLQRELEATHPMARGKVDVLGYGSLNGVETDRFKPAEPGERTNARAVLGIAAESLVLGFVGRFERDKGAELLLDLMNEPRMIDSNAHLLIVGAIEDDSLLVDLERLVSSSRATVTGWVEEPETAMRGVDVLLHPTKREGLGMVLLEAQAMEVPVLTNAVTGTVDALQDGVGGYFVEESSAHAWADRVLALKDDIESRRALGRAGRVYVTERYERARVVDRFVEYLIGDSETITAGRADKGSSEEDTW